jgi:hypothetical protein
MRRTRWAVGVAVLTVLLPSCSSAEPETSEIAASAPTTPAEIDAAELMAAVSSAQREAGTIFAYGEPVEIEAPPADQVTDASALQ